MASRANPEWRNSWLLIGSGTSLLVALVLTWLVLTAASGLHNLDQSVNIWFSETVQSYSGLVSLAAEIGAATAPLYSTLIAVLVVVGLTLAKRYRLAIFLVVSGLLGAAVAGFVKVLVGRDRPPGAAEYVTDLDKSFPSGHTMAGVYLFGALAIIAWLLGANTGNRLWSVLAVAIGSFGLLLGLTRLTIGVHWLSDVLAGLSVGFAALLLALAFVHPERSLQTRDSGDGNSITDIGRQVQILSGADVLIHAAQRELADPGTP
jgi:membrane-associated phospholipid phosphatase